VKLGSAGGYEVVVQVLRAFGTTNAEVAEQGLGAVINAAVNYDNRMKLGSAGGCEVVVQVLRALATTNAAVAQRGLDTVWNVVLINKITRISSLGSSKKAFVRQILPMNGSRLFREWNTY
jgi:hypothetical protein